MLTPKYPKAKNVYRKSIYFRCHHRTRYQKTMNAREVLEKTPHHRFKNTDCPFSLSLKFKRDSTGDEFPVVLCIEWDHNHPVSSLQALSFKDIPDDVSSYILDLFERGFTPGLAYKEFYKSIKEKATSDKDLHLVLSDRSKFPRRNDYNFLYTEYHRSKYGTLDMSTMFYTLQSKLYVIIISNLLSSEFYL